MPPFAFYIVILVQIHDQTRASSIEDEWHKKWLPYLSLKQLGVEDIIVHKYERAALDNDLKSSMTTYC